MNNTELTWVNKGMPDEVLENHRRYEARKSLYLKFGYDIETERDEIIEQACPFSGEILEAGSGKGYFSLALALRGYRFTAFDISAEEQRYAILNLKYCGRERQVRLHIADAESLPYEDGRFDIIFSVNMMHHLPSPRRVLSEFIRVLAFSGKLVISDLNNRGLVMMQRVQALDGYRHETTCTLSRVENILADAGFEAKRHKGINQDTLIVRRAS